MANNIYSWAVVGAGPAGIAAVGQLIDHGVKGEDIAWIDPEFNVGLLGRKWRSVSSNTRVSLFIKFLEKVGYSKHPLKKLLQKKRYSQRDRMLVL